MKLSIFQVDAFAPVALKGNPAAVIPLDFWLEDAVLQAIANENNLAETAYFVPEGKGFHLRWFTPMVEVDLCGHATLAAAHVLFHHLHFQEETLVFNSRSGELKVNKMAPGRYTLDFPALASRPFEADIASMIGEPVREVQIGMDVLAVVDSEEVVRNLQPDMVAIAKLPARGLIVTAKGTDCDFVSRFFAPQTGVNEDPVTGSAHCMLVPFWEKHLGKSAFFARQLSARGGEVWCARNGDRVTLTGQAITFLEGTCFI